MPYIDQQSVSKDGISLLVIKSKLVYNSMIFVDNKLTLICLLVFYCYLKSARNRHVEL